LALAVDVEHFCTSYSIIVVPHYPLLANPTNVQLTSRFSQSFAMSDFWVAVTKDFSLSEKTCHLLLSNSEQTNTIATLAKSPGSPPDAK
jgi:hypothetical protein